MILNHFLYLWIYRMWNFEIHLTYAKIRLNRWLSGLYFIIDNNWLWNPSIIFFYITSFSSNFQFFKYIFFELQILKLLHMFLNSRDDERIYELYIEMVIKTRLKKILFDTFMELTIFWWHKIVSLRNGKQISHMYLFDIYSNNIIYP